MCLRVLVAALAALTLTDPCQGQGAETRSEYEVKAAFLYNFSRFVEWPETAFPAKDASLNLCVFRSDPFDGALESLEGKPVQGRPLHVLLLPALQQTSPCHVLFVPRGETRRARNLAETVAGQPILIVGETEGFARREGAINFVLRDNRVRFEINPHRAPNLHISSKLLQLATIVESEEE